MSGSDHSMRPGPRDHLITRRLQALLADIDPELVTRARLDASEGPRRLALHLARVLERALDDRGDSDEAAARQAERINDLIARGAESVDQDAEAIVMPPEVLTSVRAAPDRLGAVPPLVLPATPLSSSDLLVNAHGQPSIGSELRAEIASADTVDLICAFVIWSGVVRLREPLEALVARGGTFRVITTTYMGATQRRAIDELVRLGAEVHIAFDARTTKLHAKAWLLERASGLTTAFIGSSNLSHTALFDGLEWNVRLSQVDAPHVVDRVRAMFETHWASEHFERYLPARDAERLDQALGGQRAGDSTSISFTGLEVRPFPHQERMLEQLMVERVRHERHRNLVVAATGTGKTVVAALDFDQLCRAHGRQLSLLFVAHREQILQQSREAFRAVLRDGSFGEIHRGARRASGAHVFGMIQSLHGDAIERLAPDAFDVVIVDEFHHAAAPSYRRLLEHLQPKELLGLTATPERMDEQDVTAWFGGRIAVELRLWEAIDEGFLVPFQYFGVADDTDLSDLRWQRGGYVLDELDQRLTGNHARVAKLLQALGRILADPGRMKALGFCVSVAHARFMAQRFEAAGLPSAAIDGTTPEPERRRILGALRNGQLRAVFSVDVLGEGVDVPDVDTVLLLRPTDSATVFTQQLGRGLRRASGKSYLTVVDLIGQQHRDFRFDRRLRAIVEPRGGPLRQQIEDDFPFLPSGCAIDLDRQSRERILDNLRAAARLGQWRTLVDDLRELGDVGLDQFLSATERSPADLYRRDQQSWTRLRREAGHDAAASVDDEERALLRAVRRMLHIDDPERVALYRDVLAARRPPQVASRTPRERRLLAMLHTALWGTRRSFGSYDEGFAALWRHAAVRAELDALLAVLDARAQRLTRPSLLAPEVPLAAHAAYTRDEILAAYGLGTAAGPPQLREGVKHVADAATDLFFVTLHKSEREYSPTTMYRDYAISRELFHWESQATQGAGTPTIERYQQHAQRGGTVVLFVRDRRTTDIGATAPYVCLGPATYVSSSGSRPVAFTWRLQTPMPEEVFEVARTVAA